MNNQDQLPTIAELWEELQSYIDFFTRHTLSGNPHDLGEMKSLRQQLLERCKEVKSSTSNFSCLWINVGKGIVKSENRDSERIDTPETAREMSAAYAFWAWELEQREKERKGD